MQQLPLAMRLRERAVFESFVPGANLRPCEQLQRAACARPAVRVAGLRAGGRRQEPSAAGAVRARRRAAD